jgi:hypothetical protein
VKLYHPIFAGKVREVPDSEADAWVEQGWRKSAPKSAEPKGDAKK